MLAFTLGMRHCIEKSLSLWEIYILIKLYIFEPLSNFRYTCLFILAFVDCLFLNILYGKDMIGYSSAQLNLNIKMIFCIYYLNKKKLFFQTTFRLYDYTESVNGF